MAIQYVKNSLKSATPINHLDARIYLKFRLWADPPPLDDVSVTYKFPDNYNGPYDITEGRTRKVKVTGTEAAPEEHVTWIVISGPQPPPAKLDVFMVVEKDNVRRRGGVALLMQ